MKNMWSVTSSGEFYRWLLLNTTDPNGQLEWLAQTLQFAEDKKEKVNCFPAKA